MYEVERLPQNIDIGYTGEQDFRTIEIDMSAWVAKVPDGQPTLMHIRPGEYEPYPVETTFENNILTWSVSDEDLGTKEGTGLLQVWFGVEDEEQVLRQLGMSAVVATIVHLSIAGEGNNSSTVQIPWLKEVMEMKNIILGYDYEAESWAVGKRGGTDVPSTDPAYHNNAKYFSEQASAAKTAAEAAQEAAETAAERDVEAWLEENFTNPDSPPLDRTLALDTAAAPADMVGNLKSALDEIEQTTENMFDSEYLLNATGWTKSNGVYTGTAISANVAYGETASPYPITGIKPNTRYYLQFYAKTNGNQGTSGNGLRLQINYTDNTYTRLVALNSYTDWTYLKVLSDASKTIDCITIGYGSNGNNVWYLKNIMLSENDIEWIPHKVPADLVARRSIDALSIDVDENTEFIESIKSVITTPKISVPVPQGFSWGDNPITGAIKTDYNGNYDIDFDVTQYDVSDQGTTYYVDPTNGVESNDGLTPTTPLKKMATAYNKSDCSCIMLADGIYDNGTNLNAVTISKNIAIKAMPEANPVIAADSGSDFAVYSGDTYSATRGSCARVVDLLNHNTYGDPLVYEKKETAANVVATPGSWALIDGVLYVHCVDGREPDRNVLLLILSNNLYAEGNPTLYLEGLTVIGGYSPLKVSNTAQGSNPKVYAKNCKFFYSETTNNDVIMLQGTELSIFQNCKAMYGMKDGFNYHAQNGTIPKAIELNCVGAMCGNAEDSNDQGSTIHDGGMAIRINCAYFRNIGSNIADEASESWNVGCVAFEPLAPNSGQRGNFYALTGTKMWIDSCRGFGNPHYNVLSATDNTTEVHLRNNIFDNADKSVSVYGVTPTYY